MRFYQNLFGPIEDEYGGWFVRVCTILLANMAISMVVFMADLENARANSQYQGPSGFWYSYSLVGMALGSAAMAIWGGRWILRQDKVMFYIYLAACASWLSSQVITRDATTNEEYRAALEPWNSVVLLILLGSAGIRLTQLWLRQREKPQPEVDELS